MTEDALRNRTKRRLSDYILVAFHQACDQKDLEVADRLIRVLEVVVSRPPPSHGADRRRGVSGLVAAHERLWQLHHPTDPTVTSPIAPVLASPVNW